MSFEDLMKHAQDISTKAYNEGYKDLMGTQSPTYVAHEEPKLRQKCSDVQGLSRPFATIPDPKSFDPMINEVRQAMGILCTGQETRDPISTKGGPYIANKVLDEMSGSGPYIVDWTGKAATGFYQNFIVPFPTLTKNQFLLASALKAALEAEQAMWQKTRENIDQIAEQTLKKLDTMDDCGSNEWQMTFTVVAAVAGVVTAVPTLGTSIAVTIAAIGGAAWVTAAAGVEDPPKLMIQGEDSWAVLDSMKSCIDKEIELVKHTESRIATAVEGILGTVHGQQDSFVAKRPALAGATKSTVRRPEYMGYSD
jgi:hypothetical protein